MSNLNDEIQLNGDFTNLIRLNQNNVNHNCLFLGTSGRSFKMCSAPIPQKDFPIIKKLSEKYEKGVNIQKSFEDKYIIDCEKALYYEYLSLKRKSTILRIFKFKN
jgi:hypothetical protein